MGISVKIGFAVTACGAFLAAAIITFMNPAISKDIGDLIKTQGEIIGVGHCKFDWCLQNGGVVKFMNSVVATNQGAETLSVVKSPNEKWAYAAIGGASYYEGSYIGDSISGSFINVSDRSQNGYDVIYWSLGGNYAISPTGRNTIIAANLGTKALRTTELAGSCYVVGITTLTIINSTSIKALFNIAPDYQGSGDGCPDQTETKGKIEIFADSLP